MSNAASIMRHMWETLCRRRPGRSVSRWQMEEYSRTWDMVDRGLIWLAIFSIVQKVETLRSPRAQMAVFNGSVNSTNEISLIWTCIFLHPSELECFTEMYIYTGKVIDDGLSGSRIQNPNKRQVGSGIGGYYETHQIEHIRTTSKAEHVVALLRTE